MKRIITLLLAICMMASLTVVAFAEETTETIYANAHLHIANAADSTSQTVKYNLGITDDDTKCTVSRAGSYKTQWVIFKFNLGEWATISEASLTLKAYSNNSSHYIYLYKATAEDWANGYEAAVTNGTDGVGTITDSAKFLTTPPAHTHNLRVSIGLKETKTCTFTSRTATSQTQFASVKEYLLDPANVDADGNVYLAAGIYRSTGGYGNIYNTNSDTIPSLRVTGIKGKAIANATNTLSVSGNTATVTTNAAAGTAKLIAASYNGDEMADVIVATVDAADAESLSVDISGLTGATKKVFLWANDMITPLADAVSL